MTAIQTMTEDQTSGGLRIEEASPPAMNYPGSLASGARQAFFEITERLGGALADVVDHPDCPPYLRKRIAELHKAVMDEAGPDVGDDIRLRFAPAARSVAHRRPVE